MYMCYPWKFQLDKSNVEGISTQEYNDHIYNKIIEFKIKKYETSFSNQKIGLHLYHLVINPKLNLFIDGLI